MLGHLTQTAPHGVHKVAYKHCSYTAHAYSQCSGSCTHITEPGIADAAVVRDGIADIEELMDGFVVCDAVGVSDAE